jgi:hypothetical protein
MLALVRSVAIAAAIAGLAGCNDAIMLRVESDRPIPQAIDAICVAIADASPAGGHFGRRYRLVDPLATLPQTLRVEPGEAESAHAWLRGDRGGVPALSTSAMVDFGGDVTLSLPRCQVGRAAAPAAIATAGPGGAHLVASRGQGGTRVVAITAGASTILHARGTSLVAVDGPAPPPGTPIAVIAIDVDGDCDDDLVIATDGAAPIVWQRAGAEFLPAESIGTATVAALAAVDIEHDGDFDLILGGGSSLAAWLNDGGGSFTHAPSALAGGGRVSMISALATGDLDGDGHADLVVGQAGPPLVAWLGRGGRFDASDGVVPAIPLDVTRLVLADADGDYDPDLAIAVRGAPMRLLVDRDGRLEDQSFVRLPQPAPVIHALAFGGWDAGCEPDAVLASDAGTPPLRGLPGGVFEAEVAAAAPPATDVVMADIDDDGDLDALYATPEGVQWLAR